VPVIRARRRRTVRLIQVAVLALAAVVLSIATFDRARQADLIG